MKTLFKNLRENLSVNVLGNYRLVKNLILKKRTFSNWAKSGYPSPPPHIVKQEILKKYAKEYKLKVLVETGTYLGDMIAALKNDFDEIYTIELGHKLWLNARKRFKHYKHIKVIEGDSSKELHKIVPQITQTSLYWLDGHYSGGITAKADKVCPIFDELEAIFNSKVNGHVILIDDARLFNGQDDYPTIEALKNYIEKTKNNVKIRIEHDIIRIVPNLLQE